MTDMKTTSNTWTIDMNYTNPLMVGVNEFGFDFAFKIDNPMPPDIGTMILYKEVDHRIVDNVT